MKVYETRNGRMRPYCVEVSDHEIDVYEQSWDDLNEYWSKDRHVYHSTYTRIFIGDNLREDPGYARKGLFPGNTILIQCGEAASTYTFIGSSIFSFTVCPEDEIVALDSPFRETDTEETRDSCYPRGIGNHSTYLMTLARTVPSTDPTEVARLLGDALMQESLAPFLEYHVLHPTALVVPRV